MDFKYDTVSYTKHLIHVYMMTAPTFSSIISLTLTFQSDKNFNFWTFDQKI